MAFTTLNPATGKVEATFERALARTRSTPGSSGPLDASRPTGTPPSPSGRRGCGPPPTSTTPSSPTSPGCSPPRWARPSPSAKGEVAKCAMCMRWYADHAEHLLADEDGRVGRRPLLHPLRAARPGPGRHAVELPALAGDPVRRPRAHGRQRRPAQARLERPPVGAPDRGRLPPGRVPRRARSRTLLISSGEVAGVIADDRVVAVTLTGSEGAGRSVAAAAGDALKKCVLELGGSDPFLVLCLGRRRPGRRAAVTARVQNNGQSCIAAKRFVVVDAVADAFVPRFVDAMAALTVGRPVRPRRPTWARSSRSPSATEIAAQVDDARANGAPWSPAAARSVPGDGWFYLPDRALRASPRACAPTRRRCSARSR